MSQRKATRIDELAAAVGAKLAAQREENGAGNGSAPWWTKRVGQWGPSVVVMFILLAVLVRSYMAKEDKVDRIAELLAEHHRAMAAQAQVADERAQRSIEAANERERQANLAAAEQRQQQARLLQMICRGVAKTELSRENCERY